MALAFVSGAQIAALAFDLFEESFSRPAAHGSPGSGCWPAPGSSWRRPTARARYTAGAGSGVSGFAILAAVTLDGVQENMALGVSVLEGTGALTLLIAIFASNLPEALGGGDAGSGTFGRLRRASVDGDHAAPDRRRGGPQRRLSGADGRLLSVFPAFAGGAVLASLADTLMPDAFREGGGIVAFATAAGFFLLFMVENV